MFQIDLFFSVLRYSLTFIIFFFHNSNVKQAIGQDVSSLNRLLIQMDNDPDLAASSWGFCLIDVSSGEVLASSHAEKSLVTASVMKAVTTATALGILSPSYQYETVLEYEGSIDAGGILKGNIYIRGSGDPTLGSDRFDSQPQLEDLLAIWSDAIEEAGIKQVEGKIIADASLFDTQMTPGNWSWEDMGNYYGAGVSGLNILENYYRLDFKRGQTTGTKTSIIRTEPFMDQLSFINEVTTGPSNSGDNAYIYGSPYTSIRYVRGTIPGGRNLFSIKGSIHDPAKFLAKRLYETVFDRSVRVTQGFGTTFESTGNAAIYRKKLHIHYSPPLSEIVGETNRESINLYAEALLKSIAAREYGKGSTKLGITVLKDYWKSLQVNTSAMFVRDGSGLSSNNALPLFQITQILQKTYRSAHGKAFYESLPVAGRSGSLKNMLKGTLAEGNLRAKSGYISAVRGYAGYVETRDKRMMAFAMLANNFTCSPSSMRRKFEKLMIEMSQINE